MASLPRTEDARITPIGYYAYVIGADGLLASRIDIICFDDEEARSRAKLLVDGHRIELWHERPESCAWRSVGTSLRRPGLLIMAEQLPVLVETSLQIAWDFLERAGDIGDPQLTAEFLLGNIKTQILRGEMRSLALSNRAIQAYQQRYHLQFVS